MLVRDVVLKFLLAAFLNFQGSKRQLVLQYLVLHDRRAEHHLNTTKGSADACSRGDACRQNVWQPPPTAGESEGGSQRLLCARFRTAQKEEPKCPGSFMSRPDLVKIVRIL